MQPIQLDPALLDKFKSKTAIITGAAGNIGSSIVHLFAANGANVVVADLEYARSAVEPLIASLPDPARALFVPTNIQDWKQMKDLFKKAIIKFGSVDIVVANAGVMESTPTLDVEHVDENGELFESNEAFKVLDINVKGTINSITASGIMSQRLTKYTALRLGLYHMKNNSLDFHDGSRGSIVLVSSTSGYFGGTGVAGYIASKHAVTGLLRGSQLQANRYSIRVNGVAPFFTPSNMSNGFASQWREKGLQANTPEGVAKVIAQMALDPSRRGACCLTCGDVVREMEGTRSAMVADWLGQDAADLMSDAGRLFVEIGGYPLPKLAALAAAKG